MTTAPSSRPRILRQDIIDLLAPLQELGAYASPDPIEQASLIDLGVTLTIAREAKVILFDTEQALALKPALDRFAENLSEYRLPFPSVMLQFSTPIPEVALLPSAEQTVEMRQLGIAEDQILALLLGQEEDTTGRLVNSASAWFASTTANRVSWRDDERAHLRMLPQVGRASEDAQRNKAQIRNLAIACIAYINCENITLEMQAVAEKINRKRAREGKRVLEDYYVCRLRPSRGESAEGDAAAQTHGFRYDVRGHFRRLPDGKLTWVRAHQRGLAHELYRPKVYKTE
jgi:hypothetical protein